MKLGIDMHHGFLQEELPVEQALQKAKDEGFDGVYYKLPLSVSPTLDRSELKAAADCARELGLYVDFGIGRVNPFNTNETPEAWTIGGGDYKRAVEKMLEAAAYMGAKELIGVTAGWKGQHSGYHVYDRFRTDVTWDEQLQATARFLKSLAPALRDTGTRINLETHEEITSFEILRLIEEVGEDVLGVAFDTANVVSRAEDPVSVARRTAPYVHQMHAKDCILYFSDTGLVRQVKPAGEGFIDFREIFSIISAHQPDLHIQIEDHKGLMHLDLYVPEWRNSHPDLTVEETAELVRHAWRCQQRIQAGLLPDPAIYEGPSYAEQRDQRLQQATSHLGGLLQEMGLRS
ncbi:sugar phosphate isomerase/epimerase family protein [Paenibacillus sp. NPDC057967]|uniref:sugar phosphate isomerase/epimerase family protein n=1 Tax=Paenibacillus sp. NPDC057967 TaxID=3346293 RepID=UPI0036D8C415